MEKRLLFFLSVIISSLTLLGQQNTMLTADSAIALFQKNYPQEKVFLQTDKDIYFSGETIWMKGWCVTEEAPSYLSQILYIDLVNSTGSVVLKKMYQLDSLSSTAADFEILSSLPTGNYSINAYTLWMLNFPEYVYRKSIMIYGGNIMSVPPKNKPASKPAITLRFFPEGGTIVEGINNRIAFKATDANGQPFSFAGNIEDKNGKIITPFASEHDAMGVFELTPEPGNEYTGYISLNNGSKLSFKLPKPAEEGITLRIENTNPSRLFVLLNRAEKNKEKYGHVRIVAQINYQIVFSANLNLDEDQLAVTISKKDLPYGILHITAFDKNNLPLAERITFIENYKLASPAITAEIKSLKPKALNRIHFDLPPGVHQPSISCLVTSYSPADSTVLYKENIISTLLVASDIRGYIHNPGYYFKDKTANTLRHLDILLMTQGWRRFEWKKIINNEFTILKYPVESGISFRGTVYKSDSKQVVPDGKVSFIIKGTDSTSILGEATTTDKGEFILNNVHYRKNAMVSYMGTNNKKENYIVDVKLFPNYIDSLKQSFNKPLINLDTIDILQQRASLSLLFRNNLTQLINDNPGKVLENVIVTAKKMSPEDSLNKEYATGAFMMGKAVVPADYKNYRTIWQMIQAAVPGVSVEGNPFDPVVTFNRFAALGTQSTSQDVSGSSDESLSQTVLMETGGIAYFLNEMNVSKDVITTLSIDDVALIKVLKNEAAALGASQGIIAIYTKMGQPIGNNIYDKAYAKQKMEGYALSKEFYQPDYSNNSASLKENDNRYTLYWQGKIVPAKDGMYRFIFYNNDIGNKFRIIIQGIDKKGNLIYKEQIIE